MIDHIKRRGLYLQHENQDYPPPKGFCFKCFLRESERLDLAENADSGSAKQDYLIACLAVGSVIAHGVLLWLRG